eukprot:1276481-Rhodomonas_salina.1
MVGLDPIPGAEYERSVFGKMKTLPVSPSDHFGLLATFRNEEAQVSPPPCVSSRSVFAGW